MTNAKDLVVSGIGGPSKAAPEEVADGEVRSLPLGLLRPNKHQPRKWMDPEEIATLKASLQTHGQLQPIVVKPISDGYMIVAGGSRFQATQELWNETQNPQFSTIRAVIRQRVGELQLAEAAYVENAVRSDLNPADEAAQLGLIKELGGYADATAVAKAINQPERKVRTLLLIHKDVAPIIKVALRGQSLAPYLDVDDKSAAEDVVIPEDAPRDPTKCIPRDSAIEFNKLARALRAKYKRKANYWLAKTLTVAITEGWSVLKVKKYVATQLKRQNGEVDQSQPKALFSRTAGRFVIDIGELRSATSESLTELRGAIDALIAEVEQEAAEQLSDDAILDESVTGETEAVA